MTLINKKHRKPYIFFSISPLGFFTIIIMAISFLLGYFRSELFALLTGITLLFYIFISLLFSVINVFLWKKVRIILTDSNINSIKINIINMSFLLKIFSFFSKVVFFISYSALTDTGKLTTKKYFFTTPVTLKNEYKFTTEKMSRGIYYPQKSETRIIDPVQLFTFHLSLKENDYVPSIVILPQPEHSSGIDFNLGFSKNTREKSTFRRSDDLYENRTYVPGDDPRKINWKIFSHTGNLSLREGELLPPPKSKYIFVFNTTKNKIFSKIQIKFFDTLINHSAGIALNLAKKKIPISISTSLNISFSQNYTFVVEDMLKKLAFPQIEDHKNRKSHSSDFPVKKCSEDSIVFFFTLPGNVPQEQLSLYDKNKMHVFVGPFLSDKNETEVKKEFYKNEIFKTITAFKEKGYHVSTI